jgi:hypothetical protein
MSVRTKSRRWLAPALAASLWVGFAPAPGPGLSAAEIAAIWGRTGPRTEAAAPAQPQSPRPAHAPSPAAAKSATDAR